MTSLLLPVTDLAPAPAPDPVPVPAPVPVPVPAPARLQSAASRAMVLDPGQVLARATMCQTLQRQRLRNKTGC